MTDSPDGRPLIRNPHPEVVRWLDHEAHWPADKPFPLTPLEAWYVMQGYTVKPATGVTLEQVIAMPGKIEGGPSGICLWQS
jgi:hypothetical protein